MTEVSGFAFFCGQQGVMTSGTSDSLDFEGLPTVTE